MSNVEVSCPSNELQPGTQCSPLLPTPVRQLSFSLFACKAYSKINRKTEHVIVVAFDFSTVPSSQLSRSRTQVDPLHQFLLFMVPRKMSPVGARSPKM